MTSLLPGGAVAAGFLLFQVDPSADVVMRSAY